MPHPLSAPNGATEVARLRIPGVGFRPLRFRSQAPRECYGVQPRLLVGQHGLDPLQTRIEYVAELVLLTDQLRTVRSRQLKTPQRPPKSVGSVKQLVLNPSR